MTPLGFRGELLQVTGGPDLSYWRACYQEQCKVSRPHARTCRIWVGAEDTMKTEAVTYQHTVPLRSPVTCRSEEIPN
ncbi:hypothetical protein GDO81_016601 [Engystomops pustulosus]|uniref:Uncharacterized protein n=1 Tax=Engystomops pustulosus TaxID=76066 RepID=A0AAV7ATA7_ENGPU|nr:hypothetical protein GDO81_016601 [Engystomops pustulosus]